jgi:hypothetical protein
MDSMPDEEYFILDPPNPLPGTMTVLVPAGRVARFQEIVASREFHRYTVRAVIADAIPLSGNLRELIARPSVSLLLVNGAPLTIHLEFPGYMPNFYELHTAASNSLSHVDVLIDTNDPTATLGYARSTVNQLLDVLLRHVWIPLVIVRLDVFIREEETPLLHQLVLPFTNQLAIGPIGGFGSAPLLAPHEALLKEAIGATSPYYRFICAYRLLEGAKYLRSEISSLARQYSVQETMPRPPAIDQGVVTGLGFDQSVAARIISVDTLISTFRDDRNAAVHTLLSRESTTILDVSDGGRYRHYYNASALLLFYAHAAVKDLTIFFNRHIHQYLARGTRALFPEDRERLIPKLDALAGRFTRPGEDDEEEDMTKPMFVKIVSGLTVEFINISHIIRIEIRHPHVSQPGGGTIHLQDGTSRTLGESEINWIMRLMSGLLGQPEPGTQSAAPGYWTGGSEPAASQNTDGETTTATSE